MSRDFNGTTDFLQRGTPLPLTVTPYTVSLWFIADTLDFEDDGLWFLGDLSFGNDYFVMCLDQTALKFITRSGAARQASTSIAPSTGVWHHACGSTANASDRSIYLDGGNKGTNTQSKVPAAVTGMSVGRFSDSSPSGYLDGRIAHVALWNVVLTDQEVASLANGVSPLQIRPDNLVHYVPLNGNHSPETDIVGAFDMTVTGASLFNEEPPVNHPIVTV